MLSMKIISLVLLAALALPAAGVDSEFRDRDKAWASAVVKHDYAALDKVFSDDLIYAHSTGIVESKAQYLAKLKTGTQRYDAITLDRVRVVAHGDTVITHSFARMTGATAGKPFDNKVMLIHVWVKENGTWRLVAHQTAKAP